MFNKPTNKQIQKNSQQQIYIGKKKKKKKIQALYFILFRQHYLTNISLITCLIQLEYLDSPLLKLTLYRE